MAVEEVRQLTDNESNDGQDDWSRDGVYIALSSLHEGNRELRIVSANGSGLLQMTDDPAINWCPAWSPDGGRLVYSSFNPGDNYDALHDLMVLTLGSGSRERPTDSSANEWFPAWQFGD